MCERLRLQAPGCRLQRSRLGLRPGARQAWSLLPAACSLMMLSPVHNSWISTTTSASRGTSRSGWCCCIANRRWWAGCIAASVRRASRWPRRTRSVRKTRSRPSSATSDRSWRLECGRATSSRSTWPAASSPTRGRDLNVHFSHMPAPGSGERTLIGPISMLGDLIPGDGGLRTGRTYAGTAGRHDDLHRRRRHEHRRLPRGPELRGRAEAARSCSSPKTTSMPTRPRSPNRWPSPASISVRRRTAIPHEMIDGTDVLAVYDSARRASRPCARGRGPDPHRGRRDAHEGARRARRRALRAHGRCSRSGANGIRWRAIGAGCCPRGSPAAPRSTISTA